MIGRTNTGGGSRKTLPTLNASYPADVSIRATSTTSATFKVEIALDGNPAQYTYQWYVNGSAVSGETSSTYTKSGLTATATYTVYCKVTNEAGSVQSRTATLKVTDMLLYKAGQSYPENTGGWVKTRSATVTMGTSYMTVTTSGVGGARTSNKVNLTNFKTLEIVLNYPNNDQQTWETHALVTTSSDPSGVSGAAANCKIYPNTTSNVTVTVDVSNLSGSYYIVIGRYTSATFTPTFRVHSVLLLT